jgi:hypothetical protein
VVADPLIGTRIGNYQIVALLGEGGMAKVYRATHPEIGRDVAIKVLSAQVAAVPDVVRRFKVEAQTVNKIDHPNIIHIFDFGNLDDGRPFYLMELLHGESLATHIHRVGALPLAEALAITDAVLDALDAIHRAQVVHRDLKPDNVFLATSGGRTTVKVLDFGIAKLLEEQSFDKTRTGALLGTPSYMAPEQCEGRQRDIGPHTDLYAVGCMLYQMLAGVVPFDAESLGGLLVQHMMQTPVPLVQRIGGLPPALSELVARCLAKNIAERPPSAAWLREQLRPFQARPSAVAETIATMQPGHASPTIVAPRAVPAASTTPGTVKIDPPAPPAPATTVGPRPNRTLPFAIAGGAVAIVAALLVFLVLKRHPVTAPADAAIDARRPDAAVDAALDAPIDAPRPADAAIDAPPPADAAASAVPADAQTLADRLRALEHLCADHAFTPEECRTRRQEIIDEWSKEQH